MWMQVVVGVGWMVWLSSGTAGLKNGLTVGAFIVLGFGLKNILDTFWKQKAADRQMVEAGVEFEAPSRFSAQRRGTLPSPNRNVSQSGGSGESSVLRRFERRYANPRA